MVNESREEMDKKNSNNKNIDMEKSKVESILNDVSLPLVQAMNEMVPNYISWCTPSIPDDIAQVRGVYKDDISVSFHTLGSFLGNTGFPLFCDGGQTHWTLWWFVRQVFHRFQWLKGQYSQTNLGAL